jgi:Family of unknown function (DUF6152)
MRNKLAACLTASVVFSILPGTAFAHHGGAAYDTSKMTTVTGTVTNFEFTNPHVIIGMDVKDPATGKIEKWQGELTSPNHLSRVGWTKETIKVGDGLTMSGAALKSGAPAMAIRKVVKNGEQISTSEGDN